MRVVFFVREIKYLKFFIIFKELIKMEINCSKFNEFFVYGCVDELSFGIGNIFEDYVGL